jgi:two-component system nitrate/nitrite response regulator NarL
MVADPDTASRRMIATAVRAPSRVVVVAQAADAVETLELVAHYRPDVLLCDERLLSEGDFSLARKLHDAHPGVPIVMLTNGAQAERALDALRSGATSIVAKQSPPEQLVAALCAVVNGDALIDPAVTMALIEEVRQIPAPGSGFRPIHSRLSNREWQILGLMSDGWSTAEIAQSLGLSRDTVYTHTRNLMRKLQVETRQAAIDAVRELYRTAARDVS